MHINEGLLQAYLDKEVSRIQREEIENHLHHCPLCMEKLNQLRELDDFIMENLSHYRSEVEGISVDSNVAYHGFKGKIKKQKWKELINKMFNYRKIAAGLATAIVFTTIVFVPPVRQAAADFLHIFRVQQIETVQLNLADLDKMKDEFATKVGEIDLKQLGKGEIVTQSETRTLTLEEAAKELPFPVKYPAEFDLKQEVQVNSQLAANFTLNVVEVNNILKQLGSDKLLPEELDKETFSIFSPGSVGITVKGGETISGENVNLVYQGKNISPEDVRLQNGNNKGVYFSQIGSPQITVPSGVDVSQLRDILLNIPIIPNELKNNLQKVQDWQHTLVVPTEGQENVVYINGEMAILEKGENANILFWVKDGVIYTLSGDKEFDLVEIAQTLRDVK